MKLLSVYLLAAAAVTAQTPANPLLVYSTLFGGNAIEGATAVAVDAAGNTYVAGDTTSTDLKAVAFPGTKPRASTQAFIARLDDGGTKMSWAYLLSGTSNTHPAAMAIDPNGDLWITGRTGSTDFPLLNPVQTKQTGLNIAFLMKLKSDGQLLFSTYLGGERNDDPNAIAIDHAGNVYIGGTTGSSQFPMKNALRSTYVGGEGFLAKFSNSGELLYSTYFGGSGNDEIYGLAVAPDDSLYVTGLTSSQDLSTKNSWTSKYIGYPSFIAKVSASGDQVLWSSYIGAASYSVNATAVAVDANGGPIVVGHTNAKTLPTTANALQPKYSGGFRDGFVLRLAPEGDRATYLSFVGGSDTGKADPDEAATAVSVDSHGYVYVAGHSVSHDLATVRAAQDSFGGVDDAWLMRLDLDNTRVLSSTYWGGDKADGFTAMALGPWENVTVVGQTGSKNFPMQQPVQSTLNGTLDATVTRFCDPWLAATTGQVTFQYTIGQGTPDAQDVGITDGCTVAHNVTSITTDAAWLNITPDHAAMPGASVKITPVPDGLSAGEYRTTIRIVVPEALNGVLELPVVLTVVDPPPPPVETGSGEANERR